MKFRKSDAFRRSVFLISITLFFCAFADAQKRDYLTEAEVEIVRNNQDIDLRINVLSRMIDRRFTALGIGSAAAKPGKSTNEWGEEPKGTKLELLTDIRYLLEKAIDDIDSLPGRLPEKMKNQKGEDIFKKSVRSLAGSATRWLPILKKEHTASETAQDEKIYNITATSIEFCEQIIEASAKAK